MSTIHISWILVVYCPVLEEPENGNISKSDTKYLTEVTYTCDVGYVLIQPMTHNYVSLRANGIQKRMCLAMVNYLN